MSISQKSGNLVTSKITITMLIKVLWVSREKNQEYLKKTRKCGLFNLFGTCLRKQIETLRGTMVSYFLLNFEGKSKLFQYICQLSSRVQPTLHRSTRGCNLLTSKYRVQSHLAPSATAFLISCLHFHDISVISFNLSANIQGLWEPISESNFPVLQKMWDSQGLGPGRPMTHFLRVNVFYICIGP